MSPAPEPRRRPSSPAGPAGPLLAEGTPSFLDDLLLRTSRTFALSVPRLPEPTRCEVTVAYLLFRVADTLEDATLWTRERRQAELDAFAALLEAPDEKDARAIAARWSEDPPCGHEGYVELLSRLPALVEVFLGLAPGARDLVRQHTVRTARRMASFVEQGRDGVLALESLADLRTYCYAVAGIVGEMLTELFLLGRPALAAAAPFLRRHAATFGEALQLVNVLKDSAADAREGRRYLPPGCDHGEVFALARRDLGVAEQYVLHLEAEGAPRGLLAFCALPILLAWRALAAVERRGSGAKTTREEVGRLVGSLEESVGRGDLASLFEEVHERAR